MNELDRLTSEDREILLDIAEKLNLWRFNYLRWLINWNL